jgi:hypothetical protein
VAPPTCNGTLEGDFSLLGVGPERQSTFSLFQSLPVELRAKIWEASLPGPRLVETRFLNMRCHLPTPRLPTPLLHISQEAREVALRSYRPLYRLSSPLPLIYIDPNVDILFVNEHIQRLDEVLSEMDPDILHSLRHIALESMMMFVFSTIVGRFFPCLLRLSSLEIITVTLPPTEPELEGGYAVLFDLLKVPMAEWPDLVQRRDDHLFTRRGLEHCIDRATLDDPRWLRTGFNNITQAVEERFRANLGRRLPRVDLKGVRRR